MVVVVDVFMFCEQQAHGILFPGISFKSRDILRESRDILRESRDMTRH